MHVQQGPSILLAAAVSTVFVVVIVVASAISLAITVLYIRHIRRRGRHGAYLSFHSCVHPTMIVCNRSVFDFWQLILENYITDEENAGSRAGTPMPTASKQKDEGEETADASVQYNSGDEAVSITSCSEEAAVACSDSEEQTKEHRSDQFQVSTSCNCYCKLCSSYVYCISALSVTLWLFLTSLLGLMLVSRS